MTSDLKFKMDKSIFNIRSCIIIRNSKSDVLVQRLKGEDDNNWALPGGKVRLGESSETCIKREIMEEFGINLTDILFKAVVEYKFSLGNTPTHQINFLFEATSKFDSCVSIEEKIESQYMSPDICNKINPKWAHTYIIGDGSSHLVEGLY